MGVLARSRGLPRPGGLRRRKPHRSALSLDFRPKGTPAPCLRQRRRNGQAPCRHRRVGCVIPPDNASVVAAVAGPQSARTSGGCHCQTAKPCIGIRGWERLRCGPVSGVGVDAQPVDSAPRRGSMRGGLRPNARIRVDSAEVHVAGGVRGTLRSCFEKSRGGARVASIRWTPNRPVGALRLMPSHIGMCVAQPRRGRQPFTQRPDGRRDLAPTRTATHPCRRFGSVWRCITDMSQRFARRFAPPPKASTPYRDFRGTRISTSG